MSISSAKKYTPPKYLAEASELLELLTCGQETGYHVRGAYSIHHKGSYQPLRESLAIGNWLPARFLRERTAGEPDLPRQVEERRTLTAHTVANHLAGKGWVGAAPPSWVNWFAFDIDLPKTGADGAVLSDEQAEQRRDGVLSAVWRAFDFGTGRLPVVLLTPGGGYHVYVPLRRDDGTDGNTWPAHVIRERVVARLQTCGLRLKDGELELWPSGKILRFPMGRQMCLLTPQNPDDPEYLGLVASHASWGTRTDRSSGEALPYLRRDIGAGIRAFLEAFEAARQPLSSWLLDDEASWSSKYGPFGDVPPSHSEKNASLTSRKRNVSQQYEEGNISSDGWLLRGEFFQRQISRLLRSGLTVEGGRHDAALKLTYYFGVGLGLGENAALAALEDWLRGFPHVSRYRAKYGLKKFIIQTLREARHYYRNVVACIGVSRERRALPLGVPLGEDLEVFDGQFSSGAVEEAALSIVRFLKGYANSEGMVLEPVELCGTLLHKLCGERRVSVVGENGTRKRVRATQLAIEELCRLGVLTLYKNYRPDHHGRYFCCWFQFGSGALPGWNANGQVVLAKLAVPEGELELLTEGVHLGRASSEVSPGAACQDIPHWVKRMYGRHNFMPGDLQADLPERLGFFRDYVASSSSLADEERGSGQESGVVVAFADDAGYGFIASDAGGADLFVHQTSICDAGFRSLRVGQRVVFTAAPGAKGPKALWVRPKQGPRMPEPENDNIDLGYESARRSG